MIRTFGGVIATAVLAAALLLLLGGTTTFGWSVGPIGEDWNWQLMLSLDSVVPIERAFWAVDYRNPLAPWWYQAVAPVFRVGDAGIALVRLATDLLVGIAVAGFVIVWGGAARARLALIAGACAVLWVVNDNPSFISWTMVLASTCALSSITCYVASIRAQDRALPFAASLVLYLLAIGTYSLQVSALIAVPVVGFFGRMDRPAVRRLYAAVTDSVPFVAIAAIFVAIWSTTTQLPLTANDLSLGYSEQLANVLRSAYALFFDRAAYAPARLALRGIPAWELAAGFTACVVVMFTVLRLGRRIELRTERTSSAIFLTGLVVTAVALSAATFALEAGNSVWRPGTRSFTIRQVVVPLVAAGLLETLLATRLHRIGHVAAMAMLLSAAAGFFATNAVQVSHWRGIPELRDAVVAVLRSDPTLVVVLGPPREISGEISDHMIKATTGRSDVNARLVKRIPATDDVTATVVLRDDAVLIASSIGYPRLAFNVSRSEVAYGMVVFIKNVNGRYERLRIIGAEDVAGYDVVYRRTTPWIDASAR